MKTVIKAAMMVSIAGLGLSLSACNSQASSTDAQATATPDQADITAAAIDQAMPLPVPSGSESAPATEAAPK